MAASATRPKVKDGRSANTGHRSRPGRILGLAVLASVTTSAVCLGAAAPSADSITRAMLENIQQNGWDGDPRINGGLGGLWINWRTGTQPLQVNFNGSGVPDQAESPRHDPLTDFRYLHNLLSWKHQHPADPQFDPAIVRFTAIVKHEFAGTHDERGWLFDELLDMGRLSGDPFFRDTGRSLAEHYAAAISRSGIGITYKTSPACPRGYYRVDNLLEMGCALAMAGTQFHRPDWRAAGENVVNFVYAHAYLREDHLFLNLMSEVRLPDGTANPDENIYREPYRNYVVDGGVIRLGNVGLEALSLLHAYIVTREPLFLSRANDLLAPLTASDNRLGLWDARDGGYFDGVEFGGPNFHEPGPPRLLAAKKESGRQFHMLQAFHVANVLTDGKYRPMEDAMLGVLLEKAYYPPGRGLVYEMAPDWSLLKVHGVSENWVTTEAMGCAMLALFSRNEPAPW